MDLSAYWHWQLPLCYGFSFSSHLITLNNVSP
jgi:hypothetical protein